MMAVTYISKAVVILYTAIELYELLLSKVHAIAIIIVIHLEIKLLSLNRSNYNNRKLCHNEINLFPIYTDSTGLITAPSMFQTNYM